jgi:hypothetical protein
MVFDEIVFVPSKEHKWCIMIRKMIIVRLSLSVCEQSRNLWKNRILKDRMTFLGDNLIRLNKNEKKIKSQCTWSLLIGNIYRGKKITFFMYFYFAALS